MEKSGIEQSTAELKTNDLGICNSSPGMEESDQTGEDSGSWMGAHSDNQDEFNFSFNSGHADAVFSINLGEDSPLSQHSPIQCNFTNDGNSSSRITTPNSLPQSPHYLPSTEIPQSNIPISISHEAPLPQIPLQTTSSYNPIKQKAKQSKNHPRNVTVLTFFSIYSYFFYSIYNYIFI